MLLLIDEDPKQGVAGLALAIRAGLHALTGPGGNEPVVRAAGESPERPDLLEIVMDGVVIAPERRPRPGEDRGAGPVVETFRFGGSGLRVGRAAIDLAIEARGVEFARSVDRSGRAVLVPAAAREGVAALFVPRASLEALLEDGIRASAGAQGITVADVSVETEDEAGGVRVRLLVTVKKLFTAKLRLAARVEPGTGPAVTLRGVSCRGDGVTGAMVAKLARPQVEALEGRELSLAAFLPPGLAPRSVILSGRDGLRVRAVLGGNRAAGGPATSSDDPRIW